VVFEGTAERGRTGMLVDGARPANSVIDQCTFTSLAVGIDIADAIPAIRRCTFSNIPDMFGDPPMLGAGIIIRDNSGKSAHPESKSLGDETDPNSGWNDFLPSVEGFAVINERNEAIPMQNNYWGTDNPEEYMMKVQGQTVQEPVQFQSSAILASSVFCTVWDNIDQKRLNMADVALKVSNFAPLSENADGVYAFPVIAEGDYSLTVEATGYQRGLMNVSVGPGDVKSVTIAMRRQETPEEEEGNGCPMMSESGKTITDFKGDILLGGLTLLAMFASSALMQPQGGNNRD
jgi:hypothetical protein